MRPTGIRRTGVGAAALVAAVLFGASGEAVACADLGKPFLSAEAAGAGDERTIRLSDGREVRLAGIAPLDEHSEAARLSAEALQALVAGRTISLHGHETKDRYGRIVAQVTLAGEPARWVQAALVADGAARAAPGAESADCARELLAHEGRARAAGARLWSGQSFAVRAARDTGKLAAETGRYTVVEGTVQRVGESGGRIFLDFGRRFGRDFSIVIPREAQKGFAEAGVDLRALSGKSVRARGVLFDWGGPALELRVPAALELLGAEAA